MSVLYSNVAKFHVAYNHSLEGGSTYCLFLSLFNFLRAGGEAEAASRFFR